MKITFTAVYDDHDPDRGPSAVIESDVLRFLDRALTYGDRHQDYDLTAIDFIGIDEQTGDPEGYDS